MMDDRASRLSTIWHVLSAILLAGLLMIEVHWQVGTAVAGAWKEAAASAVPGIIALIIWRLRSHPAWPVAVHPVNYRGLGLAFTAFQAIYLGVISVAVPGDPGALPYIPVLNPLDLAVLFAAVTALMSHGGDAQR